MTNSTTLASMHTRALLVLLVGLSAISANADPARSKPSRPSIPPAPVPAEKQTTPTVITVPITVGKVPEYVAIETFARAHGLEMTWLIPQQRMLLKNVTRQIEIEAGSRDMKVDGIRVFLGDPARLIDGGLRISRVDGERLLAGLLQPTIGEGPSTLKIIAIDPGHGGVDIGTQNLSLGLQEKVFALDVSVRLKKLLVAKGYQVVMTRETDIDVGKGARAVIANLAKADLFISVHFNSVLNDAKTRGAEVFTFAPQFQRSTNAWGKGQADDTEAMPAPVNRFDSLSVACAHAIQGALLRSLKVEDRGQKIAHWGALRLLNCPGVLVEAGFLSNEAEGKKIATPEYRQEIAEAIAEGVTTYAGVVATARP